MLTKMSITALFIFVNTLKQLKCPVSEKIVV